MLTLPAEELNMAAEVFADGFMQDPAFAKVLSEAENGKDLLYQYFLNYLSACKELLLYKFSEAGEGYMCIYRHDTVFSDFEVPFPLTEMEAFQTLDDHYFNDYAVLDIMAVAPQSRGKGIAGKMIDFFVDYCKAEGLLPLAEVFGDTHLDLYRSHGFAVTHCSRRAGITTYILEYANDFDS